MVYVVGVISSAYGALRGCDDLAALRNESRVLPTKSATDFMSGKVAGKLMFTV